MPSFSTTPYPFHLGEQRGNIQGLNHVDDQTGAVQCHSFHGIPYALPPVGPFRWKKPRPLPPCYGYGTRANPGIFTGGAGLCPQPSPKGPLRPHSWDEDCTQLNVWLPAGKPPATGWPVFFYIHGGFLQFGNANGVNCCDLLGEAALGCIVVCPAYRLGVLGFLAGRELANENDNAGSAAGNWGFWDQRLALEWTWKNISYFGGDPSNITVGGYSAGAYSAFHQLAHELMQSQTRIIRRVLMLSNSPGPPPKPTHQAQPQFDLLCSRLNIPSSLSAAAKLARLRETSIHDLLRTVSDTSTFPVHEFKPVADAAFISPALYSTITSGEFASRISAHKIDLLIGECAAEHHVYATWRPPHDSGPRAITARLATDYTPAIAAALVSHACGPQGTLPRATPHASAPHNWPSAFGLVYADAQVHALQRGLAAALHAGGAGAHIRRYRIEWRAACADALAPRGWGATHTADMPVWFFGLGGAGGGLDAREKEVVRRWCGPVWAWLRGEAPLEEVWEARALGSVRRLREDGAIDVWEDADWERGLAVWDVVCDAAAATATATAEQDAARAGRTAKL